MTGADDRELPFEALIQPELGKLYRLAYRLTGQVGDAEDLVQEVLIKAYDRRRELTSFEALGAWLGRVMYNHFVDDTRRDARRRFRLVPLDDHTQALEIADALPSAGAVPGEAWERKAIQAALAKALQMLSLEHRTVVLMHDSEGYTLEEIQTITGIPIGTVKSRLHRARSRLRDLLSRDGTFLEPESFKD